MKRETGMTDDDDDEGSRGMMGEEEKKKLPDWVMIPAGENVGKSGFSPDIFIYPVGFIQGCS